MLRRVLVCVTLLASLGSASSLPAVDYFWQNSVGGAFQEFSNWTPTIPPGPGGPLDTVNFDLGIAPSSRYLLSDVAGENSQLLVHNDSVELVIFVDYALLSAGGANPSFIVGAASGDTADVILSGGALSVLETEVTRIGNVAGSTGIVTATGLQWTGGNLRVGYAGLGTLNIEDDALVSSTNASIGHTTGSDGFARVEDDSDWTISANLFVGREGRGSLILAPGGSGSVTNTDGSIGTESSGNGGVIVAGGTWTNTDSLTIGNSGTGALSITALGASVSNTDAYVGRLSGSLGHVSARDGAWTTTGRLSIGGDADTGNSGGTGIVYVLGGTVTVENEIVIFPNGELLLDGGSLLSAIITVEPGGAFDWLTGSLRVDTFDGNLDNKGGVLATRPNSNSILVSGEYAQGAASMFSIEIAGSAASNQYDSMIVGNTAFLGGELEVHLVDLFEPGPDEVYIVLDALNFGLGSFDNVPSGQRLADASGIGSFAVHYGIGSPFDPSQVVLSDFQPAPLPGDYNGDGTVDAADYVVWRRNVGTMNMLPNDLIGGEIGSAHFDQWREHFGQTLSGGSGAAAPSRDVGGVPEPDAFPLLLVGVVVVLLYWPDARTHPTAGDRGTCDSWAA